MYVTKISGIYFASVDGKVGCSRYRELAIRFALNRIQ